MIGSSVVMEFSSSSSSSVATVGWGEGGIRVGVTVDSLVSISRIVGSMLSGSTRTKTM